MGNVQQNMTTGNPQIIICSTPPTQGVTQQAGPSIVINVPGATGGQQNQGMSVSLAKMLD